MVVGIPDILTNQMASTPVVYHKLKDAILENRKANFRTSQI
jgi:hypothetical protein